MRISWLFIYLHCGNIPWLTTFYRGYLRLCNMVHENTYSSYVYVRGTLVGLKFVPKLCPQFHLNPNHLNPNSSLTSISLQPQFHLNPNIHLNFTLKLKASPQIHNNINFILLISPWFHLNLNFTLTLNLPSPQFHFNINFISTLNSPLL